MIMSTHLRYIRCSLLGGHRGGLARTAAAHGSERSPRHYVTAPASPKGQTAGDAADGKSSGCQSCHAQTDSRDHARQYGDQSGLHRLSRRRRNVALPAGTAARQRRLSQGAWTARMCCRDIPAAWHYPSSANPERTYTLLNRERPEFIRFMNPSDFRVARESCGACHLPTSSKPRPAACMPPARCSGAAASYNNGILDVQKLYSGRILYARRRRARSSRARPLDAKIAFDAGILPQLFPLPAWETRQAWRHLPHVRARRPQHRQSVPGNRTARCATGELQRIEEPGRPDIPPIQPRSGHRRAHRRAGAQHHQDAAERSAPVVHGDQRSARRLPLSPAAPPATWCTRTIATRRIRASTRSSATTACRRPSIRRSARANPGIRCTHDFTRADSDQPVHGLPHAPAEHVHEQHARLHDVGLRIRRALHVAGEAAISTDAKKRKMLDRNPGRSGDARQVGRRGFPARRRHAQSAAQGHAVRRLPRPRLEFPRGVQARPQRRPARCQRAMQSRTTIRDKFKKAVHLHVDRTSTSACSASTAISRRTIMATAISMARSAAAVEIGCKDCHGTVEQLSEPATPRARPRSPAARICCASAHAGRAATLRVGRRQAVSALDGRSESRMDGEPGQGYGDARQPALQRQGGARQADESTNTRRRPGAPACRGTAARTATDNMECYTCHTSWTTSCGGCHLPIEANWKTERHHYEGGETRNYATYNPQVARDDMFLLGHRETAKGGKIAPDRSQLGAGAVVDQHQSRANLHAAAADLGRRLFSSQAFAPHYPHTERKVETKTCSDCHLSQKQRQQRHHGAAADARDELRQLRRLQRLGRRGRARSTRCRSPNGTSRRR